LADGGSLWNCRRKVRWTETTDSCVANCSTQNAFCSVVAIFPLKRHGPREREESGIVHMIKTGIPAVSFHVGNRLLLAFPKPLWPL
jgi:radical SAM superfamily enzyme YgiQ (UPF0313 family)